MTVNLIPLVGECPDPAACRQARHRTVACRGVWRDEEEISRIHC